MEWPCAVPRALRRGVPNPNVGQFVGTVGVVEAAAVHAKAIDGHEFVREDEGKPAGRILYKGLDVGPSEVLAEGVGLVGDVLG